jgi:endonuclease/exonuclease/phosphatase family metal-dependent hydrolase
VKYASEGHAVLARVPLRHRRAWRISRGEPPWSWRRRIALLVEVATAGGDVRLVDTHLGAGVGQEERVLQARRLMSRAGTDALVVGDLNDHPGSPVLAEFARAGLVDAWERLGDALAPATNWSGPRDRPPAQRIDFVLVPAGMRVLGASVPDDWEHLASLSDHLPVVVDLDAGD